MSVNQPATATQLNREADQEGYCVVADWLNSARLLNWVRDLQICINRVGISVVSKYGMTLLAQTVNPESNLMAGLETKGRPLAHAMCSLYRIGVNIYIITQSYAFASKRL